MDTIRGALFDIVAGGAPMTVRQVFYQAVSTGLVDKTEQAYKSTVGRLLTEMRLKSELPFDWIADDTRWMRKPRSYDSLDGMLREVAELYRRDLWRSQPDYVEIWLEKGALAGVVYPVTYEWDVPLMVTRGYPSLSFLHGAIAAMPSDRDCFLYFFGDYDPSGVDIPRNIEDRLRSFASDVAITLEVVAVTPDQIAAWNLSTRPTKRTDSRAGRFGDESVELDAIPSDRLRALVLDRIERHIDTHALETVRVAEESERQILREIAGLSA